MIPIRRQDLEKAASWLSQLSSSASINISIKNEYVSIQAHDLQSQPVEIRLFRAHKDDTAVSLPKIIKMENLGGPK